MFPCKYFYDWNYVNWVVKVFALSSQSMDQEECGQWVQLHSTLLFCQQKGVQPACSSYSHKFCFGLVGPVWSNSRSDGQLNKRTEVVYDCNSDMPGSKSLLMFAFWRFLRFCYTVWLFAFVCQCNLVDKPVDPKWKSCLCHWIYEFVTFKQCVLFL